MWSNYSLTRWELLKGQWWVFVRFVWGTDSYSPFDQQHMIWAMSSLRPFPYNTPVLSIMRINIHQLLAPLGLCNIGLLTPFRKSSWQKKVHFATTGPPSRGKDKFLLSRCWALLKPRVLSQESLRGLECSVKLTLTPNEMCLQMWLKALEIQKHLRKWSLFLQ